MNYPEYVRLVEEAVIHDRRYYQECRPLISDESYDALIEKIRAYELMHPEKILSISPTQRIGEKPDYDKFIQVAHSEPMLSLGNTYDKEEVALFLDRMVKGLGGERPECFVELKIDGLAISVTYIDGHFARAVTRGDGKMGDDVTQNVAQIATLPLSIPMQQGRLELRGEVYMPHQAFLEQNREKKARGEEPWANPRNAASGSIKLLDCTQVTGRKLAIIFYGLIDPDCKIISYQHELGPFLARMGLPVLPDHLTARCDSLEKIMDFAQKIEKKRGELSFDIDGIVIKLNHIAERASLGYTGKAPRWAIAYKFAATRALTTLLNITLQVGRTGTITPVAELAPVQLAGSVISRATLHNEDEILRKDIRIGDQVYIEKGGDVIPKVTEVELSERKKDSIPWSMPKECPACGALLEREDEQVAWRCSNPDCHDKQLARLIFFASKNGLDIEHLGKKVMEKLYEADLVHDFDDLYSLTLDQVLSVEGFAEKSAKQLLESIEKSKNCTLPQLISAIGIPHVGKQMAYLLAFHFGSLDKLALAKEEELNLLEGVGPKVSHSIVAYFNHPDHKATIERLKSFGIHPEEKKLAESGERGPFDGYVFVFTGSLEQMDRDEAQKKVVQLGGSFAGDVTKKTTHLVVGKDPGSKVDKAKKWNIAILDEKEWLAMLPPG